MSESRSSWLFLPLAGVALAAGGYLWGSRSSPPAESPAVGVARDQGRPVVVSAIVNAAIHARQETLPLAPTNARSDLSSASADEDRESLEGAQGPAELDPEEAEDLSQATRIRHFDELSRRIDTEVVDGAWRHATEEPLKRLIAEHLGPKVSVAGVTCASTFCRLRLSHPEMPRVPASSMFAFDLARSSLDVTEVEYDNRDEGVTTLYFKRGPAPATQPALAEAQ